MPVLPSLLCLNKRLSRVSVSQSPSTESSARLDDLQSLVPNAPTCRSLGHTGTSGLRQRKPANLSIVIPKNSASHKGHAGTTKFSANFVEQYDIMEVLGQGSAGLVHRVIRKADQKEFAVKRMQAFDEEMIAVRFQEFKLLKDMQHPNIIKAYDCFVSQDQVTLVLDFFSGQTLSQAVHAAPGRRLHEPEAKVLGHQLLRAVDYLHQRRIVHRDIKGENLLVSHNLQDLRLIDFNVARSLLEAEALTVTGTHIYAAPEVLNGESPSEKADMWSVGMCLLLMLTGCLRHSKHACKGPDYLARVLIQNPFHPEHEDLRSVSESCKKVLCECLRVDKNLRPAGLTLLRQDWFQEVAECMSKRERQAAMRSLTSQYCASPLVSRFSGRRSTVPQISEHEKARRGTHARILGG